MPDYHGNLWEDPAFKAFLSGWNKWINGKGQRFPNVYWKPSTTKWVTLEGVPLTAARVPKVTIPFGFDFQQSDGITLGIYQEILEMLRIVEDIYGSRLYFHPHTGGWVVSTPSSPSPPDHGKNRGPSSGDTPEPPHIARLRAKLNELDKLHADGVLRDEEWRERRRIAIASALGDA